MLIVTKKSSQTLLIISRGLQRRPGDLRNNENRLGLQSGRKMAFRVVEKGESNVWRACGGGCKYSNSVHVFFGRNGATKEINDFV